MIAFALVVIGIILLFILELLSRLYILPNKKYRGGGKDIDKNPDLRLLDASRPPVRGEQHILFGDNYNEEEYRAILAAAKHTQHQLPKLGELPELHSLVDKHRFKLRLNLRQRSKFITHLSFLTRYAKSGDQLIYLGKSEEVDWILALAELYPGVTFHVYSELEKPGKNIRWYKSREPSREDIAVFANQSVLLISDFDDEKNAIFVKAISPKYSQLAFSPGKKNLEGEIEYACWGAQLYLLVKGVPNFMEYDKIQARRNFLQIIAREYYFFPHDIQGKGIDHCLDCYYEIEVWKNYLNLQGERKLNKSDQDKILSMMNRYSNLGDLATPPHGLEPEKFGFERKKKLYKEYSYNQIGYLLTKKPIFGLTKDNINSRIYQPNLFRETIRGETSDPKELAAIMKIINLHDFGPVKISDIKDELKYHPSDDKYVYRRHMGQRKLLMNEVLFLTLYGDKSTQVIYAGAAPGLHIPWLSELFPKHTFELWDPAKFGITETDKIKLHNDYFTNEAAELYQGKNVLFMSDIRSGTETMNFEEFEEEVKKNNQWQIDWINIMKPAISMLKFRVPFNVKEPYEYLDGDVYLQPWAPINSSETRLITNGKEKKTYLPSTYENKMFYFNHIIREFAWFKHDIPTEECSGLCHCYDCSFEIWIWKEYLKSSRNNSSMQVLELIKKTSEVINYPLTLGTHGILPEIYMSNKRVYLKGIDKMYGRLRT